MEEHSPGCRPFVRAAFSKKCPEIATDTLLSSVTPSTLKQYAVIYQRWWQFCILKKHDPTSYNINLMTEFLNNELNNAKSFSSINSHKAAFALIFQIPEEHQKFLKRFMKGVFNTIPPSPRYDFTWDPHPVLNFLESLWPLDTLSLQNLTYKLVTLLALITAHRVQTLSKITIPNIKTFEDRLEILITDKIKTSNAKNFH